MTHCVVRRTIALVVSLLTAGCSAANGCIEMIGGPCLALSSTTPTATVILGLDLSIIDMSVPVTRSGYRAVLVVDATVKLHAVRITNGDVEAGTDILGNVTWSISDNTVATLTPEPDGSAQLLAIRPGRVGTISANGTSAIYACSAAVPRICFPIAVIDVVAGPVAVPVGAP